MRFILGLTGGIASGKTNLTDALRAYGACVIDADEISRALTAPGGKALPAIRRAFGDAVFHGGELDRRALGQAVFSDEEARRKLEAILHPMVLEAMRGQSRGNGVTVWCVPLLFETGMDRFCDEVWCAYVPKAVQLARLMKRSGLTRKEAEARIAAQLPNAERKRRADQVISTAGTKEESAAEIIRRYDMLTARLTGEKGGQNAQTE